MHCKQFLLGFTCLVMCAGCSVSRQSMTSHTTESESSAGKEYKMRIEHVAINVADPVAMAEWYCKNLGMKLIRHGPAPVNRRFISDAGKNVMLEIYNNPPDAVPDYPSINPLTLHIAFAVEDVEDTCERLIAAGATAAGEIEITPRGDRVAMLRDPWGVPIQFVKRTDPMP